MNMKNNQIQKNIPRDWPEVGLADIGSFSKGSSISKEQLVDTGHNAVRYGELYTRYHFQIKKIYSFIPGSIIPETKKIKYGDILFAGSGETIDEIGKSAAYLLKEDCYAGGDLIIFSPKSANSLFLSYFLNIGEARKKLRELGQGQSIVHIYKSDIEKLRLHLPSLPEQNRIVSVLETWDEAIEKLAMKIEFKKRIKKGLMQRLLTGKLRLPGFMDKWKTVKLGDVSDFINGFTFRSSTYCEDGKYKVITIANVQDGFMFIDEPKLVNELPSNISKEQILEKGDILISMTGNVGRVCTVNTSNCLLNQRVGKIAPKDINKDLLYLFLHDRRFLNKMIDGAQGGAQDNLSTGDIKEYIFDIPKSKEEQTAMANILMTADKEIIRLENKLSIIKKQKNYLLNNLITGAIRTPETMKIKS